MGKMICKDWVRCEERIACDHAVPHSPEVCEDRECMSLYGKTACVECAEPEPEPEVQMMICKKALTCDSRCTEIGHPHKRRTKCSGMRCHRQSLADIKCIPYVPKAPPAGSRCRRRRAVSDFEAKLDKLLQLRSEIEYLYDRGLSPKTRMMIRSRQVAHDELREDLIADYHALEAAIPTLEESDV